VGTDIPGRSRSSVCILVCYWQRMVAHLPFPNFGIPGVVDAPDEREAEREGAATQFHDIRGGLQTLVSIIAPFNALR
jgi:hypothetical protein